MSEQIPIISLWQPWASLVVFGEKKIETRHWKWPKGLPIFLAIHAAKKWSGDLRTMSKREPFASALALHGCAGGRSLCLPFGKIVGVVRLVEYLSTNMLQPNCVSSFGGLACKIIRAFPNERAFGDYSHGRYAWVFDRHLAIDPIAERGHQGLWSWTPTAEVLEWMAANRVEGLEA